MAYTMNPTGIPLVLWKVTFKTGFPKPRYALVEAYSWNDAADRAQSSTGGREVESVEKADSYLIFPATEHEKKGNL